MNVKKVVLLVGALLIAVITAVLAKNMFSSNTQAQALAVPQGPKVLVTRKALPVGSMIEPDSFSYEPWPKELLQGAYYTQGSPDGDAQKMVGMVVRNQLTAGQPLTRGTLVGPADRGFLAAALGPGMRAVTVAVTQTSGVAGFVFAGDRVDLVLTQVVDGGANSSGPPLKVSETIVRNLRVLATDQAVDQVKDKDGHITIKPASTVTFETTPRISEKVAVASSLGTLSLSLRSLSDSTTELEQAVASGKIAVPPGTSPAEERKMLLAVANQPIDSNTSFTTGGDVSRFQRRSVPSRAAPSSGSVTMSQGSGAPGGSPLAGMAGSVMGGVAINTGPSVRVSRGNAVTLVPVGGR